MSNQHYHSKWKSIVNVLHRSNLNVSRVAQAGSRAKHTHRADSDMDVIFAVSGDPSTTSFYPTLIRVLRNNFPNESVYAGTNNRVVHLDFKAGGKFDLVLLSEGAFDRQHTNDVNYRKKNL